MSSNKNAPVQMTDADNSQAQNLDELAGEGRPVEAARSDRRQALSFSVVGGFAALLAACGKYVARFDKDASNLANSQIGKSGSGDAGGIKGGGGTVGTNTTTTDGSGGTTGTDGTGGTGTGGTGTGGTGTTGLKPGTCLPVSVQVVDTSSANAGISVDAGAITSFKLYYGKSSRLLGIKFAASKLAAGDFVHLISKAAQADNFGKIVATRRVQSTDVDSGGVARLSFDTLTLLGGLFLDVVIVKSSGVKSKQTIDVSSPYNKHSDGLEIVDMGYGLVSAANQAVVYSEATFGVSGAPNMRDTSNIGNSKSLGPQFNTGTAYTAAQDSSTWNVSSLVSSSTYVENIYGENVKPTSVTSSNLFVTNNSFAVYCKRTLATKEVYVRYFFYVG
jgi:hypothetical protein